HIRNLFAPSLEKRSSMIQWYNDYIYSIKDSTWQK
ncbi:hypothetical protein ACP8F1_28675, partial [Klebsiella pneumoniae]